MNKKVLVIFVAFMAVAFSASSIAQVLATVANYTEHLSVAGEGIVVDIPGITPQYGVTFTFAHYDGGSHGIRDNLAMYIYSPKLKRVLMTAWFSDTDEGFAYISELMAGSNVKVVQLKPNELQVRGGESKNAIARWSVPLVAPAVPVFEMPAIIIPPGHITLNGDGDLISGQVGPTYYSWSGFTFEAVWTGYHAEGFFVCPEWYYNGATAGPATTVRTDVTQTATHP